jgi:hypothetical protein
VWDSGILEAHDRDAHQYAERLNSWLSKQPECAFQNGTVVDWAMESHRVAKENVYVLPENRKLGEDYYQANVPVVDQQLAKAGVRLAKLLNEALSPAHDPDSAIIGNKKTLTYHRPDSRTIIATKPKNRKMFTTPAEAEAAGYHLAGNCP